MNDILITIDSAPPSMMWDFYEFTIVSLRNNNYLSHNKRECSTVNKYASVQDAEGTKRAYITYR